MYEKEMDKAAVLIEAIPYIRKFSGSTVVVKYGGSAMVDEKLKKSVIKDIALLKYIGLHPVIVHGGGKEITALLDRLGKKSEFVDGLRVTDKESVEIVQMVLAGKINKSLVNLLEMKGGTAIGVSGVDGHMIHAEMKDKRLGYVGRITGVDVRVVTDLLDRGYIPVISTIGCDKDGNVYNINADTAASFIAGALSAERLISMTDIAGILMDKDDPSSVISEMTVAEAAGLRERGIISGGMIPKVECCIDAVRLGVKKVIILDGRVPHAILIETLTDEGAGTMVRA